MDQMQACIDIVSEFNVSEYWRGGTCSSYSVMIKKSVNISVVMYPGQ